MRTCERAAVHGRQLTVAAWALGAALVVLAVPWATIPLGSLDLFWQVRAGELALERGAFSRVDELSYLIAGARWNNHEWLYELAVALLYRLHGWGGFRVLALLVPGAALLGLGRWVARRAGLSHGVAVTTLAFVLAAYKFMPATQALSMALFFAGAAAFFDARWLRSTPRRLAACGFMLAWSNLTAEALVFLPFLLSVQGARLMRRWSRLSRGERVRAAGWLLAACLAPMVNPPWSSTFDYFVHGSWANAAVNAEFSSMFAPAATVPELVKWLARVVAVVLVVVAVQRAAVGAATTSSGAARATRPRAEPHAASKVSTGATRSPGQRALGACALVAPTVLAVTAAVLMERNLWLLALPLAWLVVSARSWRSRRASALAVAGASLLAWAAAVHWVAAIGARVLSPSFFTQHVDELFVPVSCAEHVASMPRPVNVFTTRLWASYVLWRAPNARVFVDGRNREYPAWATEAAHDVAAAVPAALRALDESETDVVVLPPTWRSESWRAVFVDRFCAVFVR